MKNIDFKNGKIIYNEFNIDLNKNPESQIEELQEDLLQVKYENNVVVDLGWYPEMDPQGKFVINVIQNSHWDEPIYMINSSFENLISDLEKSINLVYLLNQKK